MSSPFFEDVGAYLLGALEPAELEAFERALETDSELRAEVDRLRVAADALPASPAQMAPPPELKRRIMAIVESEAALLSAAGAQADVPEDRRKRSALAVLRPGWWSMRPQLALALTLTVLVLGGAGTLVVERIVGDGQQVTVADLGNARLIDRGSGHATLTAAELDRLDDGRVYQVWLQHEGGQPEPTNALFSARSDGTASVDVPGSLEHVETVIVTEEPQGGSQSPTTPPVIRVTI